MQKKKTLTVEHLKSAPSEGSKSAPVILTGHEKTVDKLADAKTAKAVAEETLAQTRKNFDPVVTQFRQKQEENGVFSKQVHVLGTSMNATYTFRDSYKPIDVVVENDLKTVLGSTYGKLFQREKQQMVNNVSALLEIIDDLSTTPTIDRKDFVRRLLELVSTDEYLHPVDDFRRVRYEQRTQLTADQNRILDDVVVQVANNPALSFK